MGTHRRLEPAPGLSTWWLNHVAPHMRVLMDKEGPFKKCAYDGPKPPRAPGLAAVPHTKPEAGIRLRTSAGFAGPLILWSARVGRLLRGHQRVGV